MTNFLLTLLVPTRYIFVKLLAMRCKQGCKSHEVSHAMCSTTTVYVRREFCKLHEVILFVNMILPAEAETGQVYYYQMLQWCFRLLWADQQTHREHLLQHASNVTVMSLHMFSASGTACSRSDSPIIRKPSLQAQTSVPESPICYQGTIMHEPNTSFEQQYKRNLH